MFRRTVGLSVFISLLCGNAMAENVARLHAAYQAEPFEWCPAGTPVAILLTMDGPNVVFGEKRTRSIRVNRGITGREILTPRETVKVDGPKGRFEASVELCGSVWTSYSARGAWVVRDEAGQELASEQVKDSYFGMNGLPFFSPGVRRPPYLWFGKQDITVIEPFRTIKSLSIGGKP